MFFKFVEIGMFSFWMFYIDVEDINVVCEMVLFFGGWVEIGFISWGDFGQVVLI